MCRHLTYSRSVIAGTTYWNLYSDRRFVYDGMLAVQERSFSNVRMVTYTRGPDLSGTLQGAGGIGGMLGRSHGYSTTTGAWSSHYHYHADGNGNITYLVSPIESLGASYKYDPFGNLISSSGPGSSANLYRFSSKMWTGNSALYYYGYRFYNPTLQRWMNRDPLGEEGFSSMTQELNLGRSKVNRYRYVSNNPMSRWDALGLWDDDPSAAAVRDLISMLMDAMENLPENPGACMDPCASATSLKGICICILDVLEKGKMGTLSPRQFTDQLADCICLPADYDCLKKWRRRIPVIISTPE